MRLLFVALSLFLSLIASMAFADPAADQAAVRSVFSTFAEDWNTPGFPGLEAIMTPDVDLVVVTGKWLKGRPEVVAYHRNLLRTLYVGSQLSVDDLEVRIVDDHHAVVHFASPVHFVQDGKPIARPSLATATLIKTGGEWLIDTFHNTITGGPGYMFKSAPAMPNHQ